MTELERLQSITKSLAREAGVHLLRLAPEEAKISGYSTSVPREIKARADTILDRLILHKLLPLGLPVLSEEAGLIHGRNPDGLWFIVDPLDGTYNFVRNLGPSAVSIALWRNDQPVFGAIYDLSSGCLYWGGPSCGAYRETTLISVSSIDRVAEASICTGFPARLDFNAKGAEANFWRVIKPFGKVRMIGSAAMSLVNVASGHADAYFERNIMLWDVAAGLAIVKGAGGIISANPLGNDGSCIAAATNGLISIPR